MRIRSLLLLALAACGASPPPAPAEPPPPAAPEAPELLALDARAETRIRADIERLASDACDGRGTGTDGAERAARYIEEQLRATAVDPAFADGFRQPFEVAMGGEIREAALQIRTRRPRVLRAGEDFLVVDGSASGTVEGALIDVGYGIVAEALGRGDYAHADAHGKIVLVRVGAPASTDPHASFSDYGGTLYKLRTAREHGAIGAILVAGSDAFSVTPWQVDMGIPAVLVREGLLRPNATVALTVRIEPIHETAFNVVGVVRAPSGARASEVIVVGAHYDHLGHGGTSSRAPGSQQIHNGADDNASGVALILELARAVSSRRAAQQRTVIFVAFGAEEDGALGSAYFVQRRPPGLEDFVAMLNADMVGRLRDNRVLAIGAGTAAVWPEVLGQAAEGLSLRIDTTSDGFGASDQTAFAAQQIPVLHFFTGVHDEYHRPEDDAALIDVPGLVRVATLAGRAVLALDRLDERPSYVATAPEGGRPTGGFHVSLGTVPDYGADVRGVRLTGVRPGSPADRAGVQGGDVIVGLAGHAITNIHDYVFALNELQPGRETTLVLDRSGQLMEIQIVPVPREH